MKKLPTVIDAIRDPNLFKPWFKDLRTWENWIVFLSGLFALPMTDEQTEIFKKYTSREPSQEPTKEGYLIIGRRGGKSFICALIGVFLACFRDYSEFLTPGERGVIMLIGQDRRQARVLMRYVSALLNGVDLLRPMIAKETGESIELKNGIDIEIHSCSFRSTRGYTICASLNDEVAFWRSEYSANPDEEVLNSIRPGMSTIPSAMLLCLSSPYSRKGALWQGYKDFYGKDGDTLVWQSDTRSMNPSVDQRIIDRAYERDPQSASAEYGGEFRTDLEQFISLDVLENSIDKGRRENVPFLDKAYRAFVDPSGGSRDSMTLAIGHYENDKSVLDFTKEVFAPFNPSEAVEEFVYHLKRYRIYEVTGDRYSAMWVQEAFRDQGIAYKVSEKSKSEIYMEFLPLLNSGQVLLLDDQRLFNQLLNLERRTGRSGKDSVDHPVGGFDDLANSACGVLTLLSKKVYGAAVVQVLGI